MPLTQPSTLHLSILLLNSVQHVVAFDRNICLQSAQWMLGNNTLSPESPFFYRDTPDSPPYIGANNMTLTLAGCNAICGPRQTWYSDIGPRMGTWLIPVFLLLANVGSSSMGKRGLFEFIHLLGDPIDSLWSLLHKIDAWNRCYLRAAQYKSLCPSCRLIVATVFAGHEDVQGPNIKAHRDNLAALVYQYRLVNYFDEWRRTAVHLADSRINEILRTLLALILYLYQLVSNFVPAVGGAPSSVPGSRIATSVLLSCWVPIILLTNAAGGFVSRRTAYCAMANLAGRTGNHVQGSLSEYDKTLAWSGGSYMYRPWKSHYITPARRSSLYTILCALIATTPVAIGMIGGSLLLWWETPRGFNCRHIWLITVSLTWMLSALITFTSYSLGLVTGKPHWRFVLAKDTLVAIPAVLIFFLSAAGLFNSCWCWSGPWEYPLTGRVMLPITFTVGSYASDGTIMYPATLGAVLLVQLSIFATIRFWRWRRAFDVMRWNEEILQEQSDLVQRDVVRCDCMLNFPDSVSSTFEHDAALLKPNGG